MKKKCIDMDSFKRELSLFINKGATKTSEMMLVNILPYFIHKAIAKRITRKYFQLQVEMPDNGCVEESIQIETYKGSNISVIKMMEYIRNNLKDDLAGAYLHGSLATYEEIKYSDFDALVILKSEVMNSRTRLKRVGDKLRNALRIMYEYDPLQHHGWFVLTDTELSNYNENYFPTILFKYSKSLITDKGLSLCLCKKKSAIDAVNIYRSLSDKLITIIDGRNYPENMYDLKSMLSEFMLLPSLYLQAKNGEGVYKKDSFSLVRTEIELRSWEAIDSATWIRDNWEYHVNPVSRWLLTRVSPLRKYLVRLSAPEIPDIIKKELNEDFYFSMKNIINGLSRNLKCS